MQTRVPLGAVLEISAVGALRQTLLYALAQPGEIVLEAAPVVRADTASLQLLASFFLQARRDGHAVAWAEPSTALRRAARLLGLEAALELP